MKSDNLKWMEDLAAEESLGSMSWMESPFKAGEYVVVTDGHYLVAVKANGECPYQENPEGTKKVRGLLSTPVGNTEYPLAELKDFAVRRRSDYVSETCFVHCVAVNRNFLWATIRDLSGNRYQVNVIDHAGEKNSLLVLDGDYWRVLIMAIRDQKQTGQYPEFPKSAQ